jgi:citrate synthase
MMTDRRVHGQTTGGIALTRLAEECSFEDVVHALLCGELAEGSGAGRSHSALAAQRELPEELRDLFRRLPRGASVMDCMIASVAWLGAADPNAADASRETRVRQSLRMIALLPTVVAAAYRLTTGQPPIRPLARLPHARNFLYMLSGHGPDEDAVSALDDLLILVANDCDTILSDRGDYHSAITAALCALKASGIGAGIERTVTAMTGLRERCGDDKAMRHEMAAVLGVVPCAAAMGAPDERTQCMKRLAERLSECAGETAWIELCEREEQRMTMTGDGRLSDSLYSGLILHLIGIPPSLYAPVMALGMVAGWSGSLTDASHTAHGASPGYQDIPVSLRQGGTDSEALPASAN